MAQMPVPLDVHYAAIFSATGTWIAAIGSVSAVSVALWQLFRNRRDALARDRIMQASQVAAWLTPDDPPTSSTSDLTSRPSVTLSNSSQLPIFSVVAYVVFTNNTPNSAEAMSKHLRDSDDGPNFHQAVVATLPPGRYGVDILIDTGFQGAPWPGVELAFTDASGNHWIRRASGSIESISTDPINYFELVRPLHATVPTRL